MFRFNFQVETTDEENVRSHLIEENKDIKIKETLPDSLRPVEEHKVTDEHLNFIKVLKDTEIEEIEWRDELNLKFISSEVINHPLEDDQQIFDTDSDLIPSVYEGGFKIWECTWDLLKYIKKNNIDFKNKRVLELGCGSGILGIAATLEGSSDVSFQDYNKEVIRKWTIPNVLLNMKSVLSGTVEDQLLTSHCSLSYRFYSGDWSDLLKEVEKEKFDYILSSETIYNRLHYSSLINIFSSCLKVDGVVLLASKSHYFGVGGGTHEFSQFISRKGFKVASEMCNTEGVNREILTINKT